MPSPSPEPDFRAQQLALAAHLRDPAQPAPAGIAPARLALYRHLVTNNLDRALSRAFPVLQRLLGEARWAALQADYLARHRSPEPLFHRLAADFLAFLDAQRGPACGDPPWLQELAHYEWIELALALAEDPPAPPLNRHGDLLEGRPLLTPQCATLAYEWPVHRLAPDFLPAQPPSVPSYLVVFRDAADAVQFLEVTAVTARLLTLIEEQPQQTGRALLEQIAEELQQDDPDAVVEAGASILETLRERGIVLGTRRERPAPVDRAGGSV